MNKLHYYLETSSIKSFDNNSMDLISIEGGQSSTQNEDLFSKIFIGLKTNNKDNDDFVEKDTENIFVESKFKINSFKKNNEEIVDIKKESTMINEDNKDNLFGLEISQIFEPDKLNSDLFINNNINNSFDIFNNENDILKYSNNIIIQNLKTKKKDNNLNVKTKKILFKTTNPSNFFIFNKGEKNNYARQIINEVIKNGKNKKIFTSSDNPGNLHRKKRFISNIRKRRENSDNIRKKIKSRFLKTLRNRINEILKLAGSEKFFSFLPQMFVCNVSKEKNRGVLDMTFKEVFTKNFYIGEKVNYSDLKKYYHNLSVIEYLENNKDISEKSNYNIFKNIIYNQIYDEYLNSKEFELEIEALQKTENEKYIKLYINKAINLTDFFCK